MKRKILLNGILTIVCLVQLRVAGQVDTAFIHYLQTEGLRAEHETYLNKLRIPEDSLHYFKAKLFLHYREDSSFLAHFEQSVHLFQSDTTTLNEACYYFISQPQMRYRNSWFGTIDTLPLTGMAATFRWHYRMALHPEKNALELHPEVLQEDYGLLLKASRKRPWIASTLALIPGMGQLYHGKYRSFIVEFVSLTLTALQTAESAGNTRITHPLTVLNACFFSAFYTSGIVGAWRDTQQLKEDAHTQYLLHVATYYRDRIPSRVF